MTPTIEQSGDTLLVRFTAPWAHDAYNLFLRTKALPEHAVQYDEDADAYTIETPARFAALLGIEAAPVVNDRLPFLARLWDYQAFLVRTALDARRYAIWADTGLGKTPMELEWARQVQHRTNGKVLGVYFLNLIPQVLQMAAEFYPEMRLLVLDRREDLIAWCKDGEPGIAITNPEKFIPRDGVEVIPEITYLAGVLVDESSLLKTGGGKIKWSLIKSCRGVEFKLSCTATPAPNDPIEYASQASFLEKIRDEGEVIWTYFTRDADGEWKIKNHALEGFYQFLSGWSCYLRSPARYGFADNLADIPAPERFEHVIPATAEQLAYLATIPNAQGQTSMFEAGSLGIVERTKLGQLASGFLYRHEQATRYVESSKGPFIAHLVRREVAAGLQVLVWTLYDETVSILENLLALTVPGDPRLRVAKLTGDVPREDRQAIIDTFRAGGTNVLITRARMLGFGTNLQNVGSMVWADFNDSAEQIYQGERRAVRYGQTRPVRIHFPYVQELQGAVWQNVQAKQRRFLADVETMEGLYVEAMAHQLAGAQERSR